MLLARFIVSIFAFCLLSVGAAYLPACAQKSVTTTEEKPSPHLGSVEEALVGVEVIHVASDGTKQVRRGNGFVLRCDGFVLLPTGLLSRRAVEEGTQQSIRIILHPGTEQERRVASPARPFILKTQSGYAVVKLQGVHIPALQTLLPEGLKEGDEFAVAFRPFDAESGRYGSLRKSKIVLGAPISKEKTEGLRGVLAFAEPLPDIPPGAVLIGPEGLAVGVVPGAETGTKRLFVSFEFLHQTTNCVTSVSTSEAEFRKRLSQWNGEQAELGRGAAPESPPEQALPGDGEEPERIGANRNPGGMVQIPGGKVRLTPALLEYQRDMNRVPIACVAPFWIDKYEVTNAQYGKFWNSLTAKQRADELVREKMYPLGWADRGEPFPADMSELPVIGVRLEGARAYAKWAGKRLPTPYEWSLAAFGPEGGNTLPEWTGRYIQHRQQNWARVRKAHFEFLEANRELQPKFRGEVPLEVVYAAGMPTTRPTPHENPRSWHLLPWFLWLPEHGRIAQWSQQVVREATDAINREWISPLYILAGGERKYDVSPYGVHDMASNAIELICPVPEFNEKRMELSLYMQLAWIATDRRGPALSRLFASDMAAQYEAVMNDTPNGRPNWGEFPLLSRRLHSATNNISRLTDVVPPRYSDLVMVGAGLFEAGALLRPLSHGVVRLFEGPTANIGTVGMSADGSPSLPPVISDGLTKMMIAQTAAFSLWNSPPRYFRREMGRLFAMDPPEGSMARSAPLSTSWTLPADTTLLPGGFRCAR